MPQGEQGIYDPANNVTHFYSATGAYQGAEPGDVSSGKQRSPSDLGQYTERGPGGTPKTDWSRYIKDNVADLIPAGVTALAPELKGISPLMNVAARMGGSTAIGAPVDMLLNANNDKPKIQSVVDAAVNSILGSLPELANVGLRSNGITRTSTTNREPTLTNGSSETKRGNSGSTTTNSSSSTSSGPVMQPGPSVYVPGLKGRFGRMEPGAPVPTGSHLTETTGSSTTNGGGQGVSNTTREGMSIPGISRTEREVGAPGMWGHIIDVLKSVESYKRLNATGGAVLNAPRTALLGLLANMGFDTGNRPQE